METNEIVPVETASIVTSAQQQANFLKVTNPEQAEKAATLLRNIKDYRRSLLTTKEEMTRPLMKSLAKIRNLFKPLESDLDDAERIAKNKLLAYNSAEELRLESGRNKVAARVERGTMRADTAAEKIAALGEVKKTKGIQFRTLTKIRIMDETLIPREYLVPNMKAITEAVLHQNIDVPGVEKYEEKTIASV